MGKKNVLLLTAAAIGGLPGLLKRSGEAEGHESGSNEHSGLHDYGGVLVSDFACEDGGEVIVAVFAGSSLAVSAPSLYLPALT